MQKQEHYLIPSRPRLRRSVGIRPLDLDHVNLLAPDVGVVNHVLTVVLGMRESDLFYGDAEFTKLLGTWLRATTYHHDLAIMTAPAEQTLHHVAWTVESWDHIKHACDLLAHDGITLEWWPGRHSNASNLAAYFQAPGGNRYELTAEMGRVPDLRSEPGRWTDPGLTAWGQQPFEPEAFWMGT
jgi:catechol 2,3-dioxygenase